MTPRLRTAASLLFLATALLSACTAAEPDPADRADAAEPAADPATAATTRDAAREPGIRVVVTVDWEGADLASENLAAIETFRSQFPAVPLVHFLNAAYYTKAGVSAAAVTRSIKRTLRAGDELGLHLHGWKRLFEAAGVTFRTRPTFWGTALTAAECVDDCGHEVPISAYTRAELRAVLAFSLTKLQQQGFGRATSFRAGGWLASATVRGALLDSGFVYDHSAVPPAPLSDELVGLPLLASVRGLWNGTTASTQPYQIRAGTGTLIEIVDNGALADYVTASEMVATFDGAVAAYLRDPTRARVVSIGFHQETAADYLPRVRSALRTITARAAAAGVAVHFVTSADATAR